MVAPTHGSPFTYDDLQRMPDDGRRYELLDGALLVTPTPGTAHQVCVSALVELLRHHRRPGDIVLPAPFDYVVSLIDRARARRPGRPPRGPRHGKPPGHPPARRRGAVPQHPQGGPHRQATGLRRGRSAAYWIIDPDAPSVTVLELVDGRYQESAVLAGDESFTASRPFAVPITPARLLDDLR